MNATTLDETFGEVRARISAEHAVLKTELALLESAARTTLERQALSSIALHEALWAVYTHLLDHLAMEETHLLPFFARIGLDRVDELLEDHRQQRVVLDAIMDECECGTKDDLELADDAKWLVESLTKDIEAEEKSLDTLAAAIDARVREPAA